MSNRRIKAVSFKGLIKRDWFPWEKVKKKQMPKRKIQMEIEVRRKNFRPMMIFYDIPRDLFQEKVAEDIRMQNTEVHKFTSDFRVLYCTGTEARKVSQFI